MHMGQNLKQGLSYIPDIPHLVAVSKETLAAENIVLFNYLHKELADFKPPSCDIFMRCYDLIKLL